MSKPRQAVHSPTKKADTSTAAVKSAGHGNPAELERAASEWQQTFDAISDVVALISPDFKFLRLNRAGYENLPKKAEKVIGKKCCEIVHGQDTPVDDCPCVKMMKTGKPEVSELTMWGRHYIATASPILDEKGELIAFAHTVKDITDLRSES